MKRQLAVAALLLGIAQSAFAQLTPTTLATVWVDESGNVARTVRLWHDSNSDFIPQCDILSPNANGECGAMTSLSPSIFFTVAADPGPGGLNSTLIYTLPSSLPKPTQGDVVLKDGSTGDDDVIRFNGDRTLVYYSGELPLLNYGNSVAVNKVNPWTAYVPKSGQSGFGYSVLSGTSFVRDYLTYAFRYTTPADMLLNLAMATESVNFQQGEHLLFNALAKLNDGNATAACNQVNAFVHMVSAQTDKKLTTVQASWLILSATNTMVAIGCQ